MGEYNLREYPMVWKRRENNIRKNLPQATFLAAKKCKQIMRVLCPKDTGALKNSITAKKNVCSVRGSNISDGFPYIHWVNQTPGLPFTVLNVRPKGKRQKTTVMIKGSPVFVPGGKMIYGQAPSNWNFSGSPGFVTKAADNTRFYFLDKLNQKLRISLEV